MNPYPSMTSSGWITDPDLAIASIMADYCYCEHSATKLYTNQIRSLPYQLMRYTDPDTLAGVVQEDLIAIYKSCFDNVECIVEYDEKNQGGIPVESPRFRLEISLIVYDGTKRYTLVRVISVDNGKVISIGESVL